MSQPSSNPRGRWVAIITGAISVLIGVLYLVLIAVLDQRGPLLPPPPEALGLANSGPVLSAAGLGAGGEVGDPSPAGAAQPGSGPPPKTA